jgi:hypothetical protein
MSLRKLLRVDMMKKHNGIKKGCHIIMMCKEKEWLKIG